ncbi:hypothetical protein GH714_020939 [Hevea brasiliensis]|uniref:Uncharacterized protein n=1 Tax=Hevea brasiliensis TaxID=3981 RepID=A0A6A6KTG7_HEVBR|nr:hypothetical protein GH714_020939 [Hevea brasiliensis]
MRERGHGHNTKAFHIVGPGKAVYVLVTSRQFIIPEAVENFSCSANHQRMEHCDCNRNQETVEYALKLDPLFLMALPQLAMAKKQRRFEENISTSRGGSGLGDAPELITSYNLLQTSKRFFVTSNPNPNNQLQNLSLYSVSTQNNDNRLQKNQSVPKILYSRWNSSKTPQFHQRFHSWLLISSIQISTCCSETVVAVTEELPESGGEWEDCARGDKTMESEVGNEILGGEDLHGGGTGVVPGVKPVLDTGAIVCDAVQRLTGGLHYVERYRAPEEIGYAYVELVSFHLFPFLRSRRERKKERCIWTGGA